MVALLAGVISNRRAEQASGSSTVEKTDLLQVQRVFSASDKYSGYVC